VFDGGKGHDRNEAACHDTEFLSIKVQNMTGVKLKRVAFLLVLYFPTASSASAQVIEIVGSRALGMGGAFVAVASDSSATWWNPAGLATGPYIDVAVARALTEQPGELPARRGTASWFALGTPPIGVSYYRLRLTDVRPLPTDLAAGSRQDDQAGAAIRSLTASQLGVTLVQTIVEGVHVGTTVKYLRGTLRVGRDDSLLPPSELLDRGGDLEGGEAESKFDLDIGVLAEAEAVRLGLLVKNVVEPEFSHPSGSVMFPRQFRLGLAVDASKAGGIPLTAAVDLDLRTVTSMSGERRNLALGVEQWFGKHKVALRGGGRFNMAGSKDRAATAGGSLALRAGLFLDGYLVRGGSTDERGWGVASRVSF
jgi:hypothetical protein